MKFNIGDRVNYFKDIQNSYIVVATKEQVLDAAYLKSVATLKVSDESSLAAKNIKVQSGFDYRISKITAIKEDEEVTIDGYLMGVFDSELAFCGDTVRLAD